jgi:hypothetical protein
VVEGTCLENKHRATYREFESHHFRIKQTIPICIYWGRIVLLEVGDEKKARGLRNLKYEDFVASGGVERVRQDPSLTGDGIVHSGDRISPLPHKNKFCTLKARHDLAFNVQNWIISVQ